jgi:hypothetical protein
VVKEIHSLILFSRSALVMTETELKVIAALAMTGLKSNPKKGYNAPQELFPGAPKNRAVKSVINEKPSPDHFIENGF